MELAARRLQRPAVGLPPRARREVPLAREARAHRAVALRLERIHHLVLADEHFELRALGLADEDDARRQHRVG